MSLLALSAVLLLQSQSEPIGELSKKHFLGLLDELGYKTENSTTSPYHASLTDGKTSVTIYTGFGRNAAGSTFVMHASADLNFDVPRNISKQSLADWAKAEKIEPLSVNSFLGGRVAIGGYLGDPKSSREGLKKSVDQLLENCRKLKQELARSGGREASDPRQVPKAPLNPNFILDWIDQQDLDYLRVELGWGKEVGAGGWKGWLTGAQPLGIPIVFNGMGRSSWISLTCLAPGNPEKVDRYVKRNPNAITWARGSVARDSIYIQKRLDGTNSMTVRDLTNQILDFARKIKALDIY